MKVFTVGLDQKPPLKDGSDPASEKAAGGSPPPGYVAASNVKHIPLPMGPELPQPPTPIVVRKSRGYKGILMVMLAVFLMALFALTLSEIAYNRQRDENFFRLRWAELKHRLGYGENAPYDYYHRANGMLNNERFFSLGKNRELAEALIQQSESTSTTTPAPSSTQEPVVAIADSFPPKPSSFEQSQPDGPNAMIRDARLQFLKTILQKIKQHAEDMGFDGTMQVSVIEVEPQVEGEGLFSPFGSQHQQPHLMGSKGQQQQQQQGFHPMLPSFFPHFPIDEGQQQQQVGPKSDSFLDGFGEFHQPTFMQNNQVVEQNRARGPFGGGSQWPPHDDDSQQQPHNGQDMVDVGTIHWPRANSNPFRPDAFFHPMNNWQILPPQQQQQGFPQPPHILPRPFDYRWSGAGPQPMDGAGEENNNNNNNQQQPQLHGQAHVQQQQLPLIFPHGQQQQQQQQQMPMMPPPPPPPMMNGGQQQQQMRPEQGFEQKSGENFPAGGDSSSSSNSSPSQEVVGEIYGRKFGRMLQDIIANRIQGFQNMQQVTPLMLPPSAMMGGNSQPDQRSRLPFGGENMPPMPPMGMGGVGGSPFFQQPPQASQQQQMPMPQQWWQPGQQQQQQQIAPSNVMEEAPGRMGGNGGDKSLPPPPPIIFFPMGQGQASQPGQPQPFPSFGMGGDAKDLMGQKQGPPAQLQFPVFKNFIPPEDRIQVEPPQTFPNQHQQQHLDGPAGPLGPVQPQRGSSSSNSDEPLVKTVVDNNMSGPRVGWTHQLPKSQQQQPDSDSGSDSNSQERENVIAVAPPPVRHPLPQSSEELERSSPLGVGLIGGSDKQERGSKSDERPPPPPPPPQTENDDVWLVAPPHRTQAPHMTIDGSSGDTSAVTPVDFPAVKFPMMGAAGASNPSINNLEKVVPGDAVVSTPQNDHQSGGQPVHSNPVFFQVDDPSSVEQQAPRTLV